MMARELMILIILQIENLLSNNFLFWENIYESLFINLIFLFLFMINIYKIKNII